MRKIFLGTITIILFSLIIIVGCKKKNDSTNYSVAISAPTGLSAHVSGSSVHVTWNSVDNARCYKIYYAASSNGDFSSLDIIYNGNSYIHTNPHTYNYYKVSAIDSNDNESALSSSAYCYYSSGGGGGSAPSAPTNVSASVSGSSVQITWNSVSGATSYKIYKSNSPVGYEPYTYLGSSNNTSYIDSNPLTDNYYKVTAVNNIGESSYSSSTYSYYSGLGSSSPSTPTNVSASIDGSSVLITWDAVYNAGCYFVYRASSSNGTYTYIGTTHITPSFPDRNPLTDNYYKISAMNSNGESDRSSYTYCHYSGGGGGGGTSAPNAPTGINAYFSGSTAIPEITISWNSVSNATSYKIYRSSSAYGSYSYLLSTSGTYTYDFNPLNGTNYYKVKAVNDYGESSFSDYVSCDYNANGYAPCPPHYTSHTATSTTITLRWSNPTTSGCGSPTTAKLRVWDPTYEFWFDLQTLSGSTTSTSFNYTIWSDSDGYIRCGILTSNSYGNSGGLALAYNWKTNTWYGGNGLDLPDSIKSDLEDF